jgi:hypothetical protein
MKENEIQPLIKVTLPVENYVFRKLRSKLVPRSIILN